MSVNIDLDDYYVAQELLDKSDNLFLNSKDDIASVLNTLDGQVLAYVRSDLKQAQSTISLLQKNNDSISEEITVQVEKVAAAEAKAKEALSEITGATEAETKPLTGNEKTWEKGKSALSSIGDFFVSLGKGIVDVGASLVSGTVSLLTGNLGGLFDSCKSIFNAACDIGKSFFSFVKKSFDFVASFFASAVASVANLVMSLVEGIVSFVEAIVDAAALIVGVAASLFTGLYDGINWIGSKIFGYEFKSATKAMWADGIMPFIGTDWTDKAFDALYTVPPFKWMEDYAFGPFKREGGMIYSIGKGVGYTIGIVLATVCTAGIAGGASGVAGAAGSMSTSISTAFAGLGAMGKNTQKGYNKLSDEEKQDGWSLFKVGAYGVGSGAIEAGAWYLTFGNGKTLLTSGKNMAGNTATNTIGWTNKMFSNGAKGITTAGQKVFGEGFKIGATELSKMGIQFSKTYANATLEWATINPDKNVFSAETFQDATTAAAISLIYDKTLSSHVGTLSDKVAARLGGKLISTSGATGNTPNPALDGATSAAGAGEIGQIIETVDDNVSAEVNAELENIAKSFVKNGCGKVFGGFIKKFMDLRNAPQILGIAS